MLEFINSPEELSNWMSKNISYGYVNKNMIVCNDLDFYNEYMLQSPNELLKSKIGVCWDQVEFERYFFKRFKIVFITIYMEQNNINNSSHTILIYTKNNKYFWFENSYEIYRGIHGPFDSVDEIVKLIHEYMYKDEKDKGYSYYIYHQPEYDINCEQYLTFVKNKLFKEGTYMKRLFKKGENMKRIFLGGTCSQGTKWRDELIKLLDIDYFNPVVNDWNEEAQKNEIYEREHDDYCLYTITPKMAGVYSIAEVIDDSNKRPEKTIFCILEKDGETTFTKGQLKSLVQVGEMVKRNGGQFFMKLSDVAEFVNTK